MGLSNSSEIILYLQGKTQVFNILLTGSVTIGGGEPANATMVALSSIDGTNYTQIGTVTVAVAAGGAEHFLSLSMEATTIKFLKIQISVSAGSNTSTRYYYAFSLANSI